MLSAKPLKTRKQRKAFRIKTYWASRIEAAPGEQGRASVRWDWLRTEISRLPEGRQEAAWRRVSRDLEAARVEIAGR